MISNDEEQVTLEMEHKAVYTNYMRSIKKYDFLKNIECF